jgi:hypothetical protein
LFAIGFSTGRPRLPIGALSEGVDEAYALMHPNITALSNVIRENNPLIEILSLIATATVVAGAVLAGREALRDWLRGRRPHMDETTRTIGTTAFVIGAIVVPMTYLFNPTTSRALLGIAFLAVSGIWAHTKRNFLHP